MKRILITGATSGIGLQLAKDYAADGWQVFGCGRRTEALADIANLTAFSFDVTDKQALQTAADTIADASLDMVLLNAGTCEYQQIDQFDGDSFARVINTNLIAVGYCLQFLLPKLKPGAQLALTGSAVVHLPFSQAEAYGASKAAIHYLAQSLQRDLHSKNISVSEIQPGFVDTPLTARNQFAMPWLMTVEQASQRIRAGIANRKAVIAFPWPLLLLLKLVSWLPLRWQLKLLATQPTGEL
ncbi:SDR family NAD(P)-dependent oxidoreductase [Shewanella avicenniae]|uniref:SDR family NAD(P)-dependent oxidoreductase n=1 Tax=Shewanella avicenniae TaxID=2814294 RepID=A0ABX7QUB0_9GAMM|nr:SDR family NAD(P)-dependent oxidoreductase [Shewanella avicenniae]QSX34570.1 SDR family NAD(P)-dependent oxidoreductase [Shewanella avicenniae]